MSRLRLLAVVAALPLGLWLLVSVPSDGAPLGTRIDEKRQEIEEARGREQTLTSTISGYTDEINTLQEDIVDLHAQQVSIQQDLDRKRAELARIQDELRRERIRLVQLRERLAEARAALAERLVELYKADRPDVVTVILEADGFADLLTRTEFMRRVSSLDKRIIERVRTARDEAVAAEKRLDALEARQREVTEQVDARLQEVESVRGTLVSRREEFASARRNKWSALHETRAHRHDLEGHLASLEKEQAKIQARLAGVTPLAAGPVKPGSGQFIWPVDGVFTSPFGMRWGRLHAGIDIGAAEGTPIRAAASGTVVLAAYTGGYGNYTCIDHGGGMSTCYGHQSAYATSSGARVSQGAVIGYVGNTGNSFGAHLHFEVRINGSPVDPMGYL